MFRSSRLALMVAFISIIGLGACGSDDDSDGAATEVAATEGGVMLGPNNEPAVPIEEIPLTEEDVEKLKQGNYTAAFALHETSTDLPNIVRDSMEQRMAELGMELVAVTDAEFDAAKQRDDVETLLAREPDVIVSIPVDAKSSVAAFRAAQDAGSELVFWDTIPEGFEHGKDYVGVVSSDQVKTGENTAQIMCDALGDEGKVGVIFFDADFYVTNQRDAAFKDSLAQQCPDVEIVAEEGFEDPGRVEGVASAMLTRNPDLDGIYATWAEPAEGVLAALRAADRDDVEVVTVDLSEPTMIDLANGGPMAGASADRIADLGVAMAEVAGLGALGKPAPAFSVVTTDPVTEENVLEGWEASYGEPAPPAVQEAVEG